MRLQKNSVIRGYTACKVLICGQNPSVFLIKKSQQDFLGNNRKVCYGNNTENKEMNEGDKNKQIKKSSAFRERKSRVSDNGA